MITAEMIWPGQLFPILGLRITAEAQAVFDRLNLSPMEVIAPHFTGKYDHMTLDEAILNLASAHHNSYVASWHALPDGTIMWVITSGDRKRCRVMVGPSEDWRQEEQEDESPGDPARDLHP